MKNKSNIILFLVLSVLSVKIAFSQLDAHSLFGMPIAETLKEMNDISSPFDGSMLYNREDFKIYYYNGTSWVPSFRTSSNWDITGNSGTTNDNFLGTIDDVKMQIRSNNLPMLEFGRRETLKLYRDYPDYRDNNQPMVYVRGNGATSALQFAAGGDDILYKPMFFTTTNGSFRLKGSAGRSDFFEIGSAGPDNKGRLEFIIGDDGDEPIIFKRYDYRTTPKSHKELFRVQGSKSASDAKTRFGININPVGVPIDGTYNNNDSGDIANSTFQVKGSISKSIFTTTGNLLLTEDYYTIVLGGNHNISLPTASSCEGRIYVIKNPNAFATTISAYINELGENDTTISSNTTLRLQSDAANWQQIAAGKGEKGTNGLDGKDGTDGPQGEKGDAGVAGTDGAQGLKGEKGDAGVAGTDGAQGLKGEKGDEGAAGTDGAQGLKGEKGDAGEKGDKGEPGIVNSENWSLTGNSGTTDDNFVGTTDAKDVIFKSNGKEKLRLKSAVGQVLVNQATVFKSHPLVIRANGVDVLAFEDKNGTPKWHWNLLTNGLNFVESGVLDFRLFLENGGNVGVNTNTPTEKFHVAGGNMRLEGAFKDSNNEAGTPGQVLSSTVTGTDWVDGVAGPKGDTGAPGIQGAIGPIGVTGKDGTAGINGTFVKAGPCATLSGSGTAADPYTINPVPPERIKIKKKLYLRFCTATGSIDILISK